MDRPPRPEHHRVTVSVYSDEAAELRRVARLLPGMSANGIGRAAIAAGLPLVERKLRDAACRLTDEGSGLTEAELEALDGLDGPNGATS